MDPVTEALLLKTVERLDKENELLKARVKVLEEIDEQRAAIDARRSSIEVGHADKGGLLKVYTDPYGDAQANIDAVNEQRYLLAMAGGVPKASTLTPEDEAKLLGRVNKKLNAGQTTEEVK